MEQMTGTDNSTTIEPRRLRAVMGRFATGVTIISTVAGDRVHGMTVNAFMSGSLAPPLCLVSVGHKTRMHGYLAEAGHFSVNMLAQGQEHYSRHFSGQPVDGLEVPFAFVGRTPVLVGALARVAANVVARHECGDHTLFVGEIFHLDANEGEPLLFYDGHYVRLVHDPVEEAKPADRRLW